jgi:hypothetical protein
MVSVDDMDSIRGVPRTTTHNDKTYNQESSFPCCTIHQPHSSGNHCWKDLLLFLPIHHQNLASLRWTVFLAIMTLTLCVFSPVAGLLQAKFHRYKGLMVFGSLVKLVGHAICIASHNQSKRSTAVLAVAHILIGGSAFIVIGARVG